MKLEVASEHCTRCGACAALCPEIFVIEGKASRVARAPSPDELADVEAARWICPTDAIRLDEAKGRTEAGKLESLEALFPDLAIGAERVRWSLESIPWNEIDPSKAKPELKTVVREMAFSENATYSATQRFLEAFYDDVDFTQWIAVWFYEETRHPHVLLEWLRRIGEPESKDFVLKGRVSTPFMRSVVGTLVTNVISEVTAAHAYRRLARKSPEPVLSGMAKLIAGDEARHAASFFRFARKQLRTLDPEAGRRERARGLEVLQAWLGGTAPATHPVAQMMERLSSGENKDELLEMGSTAVRTRVVRVVGLLLDLPLSHVEDVGPALIGLLGKKS